jgi:hypothetical protein
MAPQPITILRAPIIIIIIIIIIEEEELPKYVRPTGKQSNEAPIFRGNFGSRRQ